MLTLMSIVTAIQQRLIDAGLIGAAKTDLDSNPAYFACCFAPDQPDAEEIMGPE